MPQVASIADQLVELAETKVPRTALEIMRLSLFDWAACGIAGAAAGEFSDFATAESDRSPGAATVIGGGKATLSAAALLNGTISHALDYDDTHFDHIGHPSVAVLPATFAVAEAQGASLDQLIHAATIGVEASIHLGMWLGRDHYQVGYHQTATAGAFGALLACSVALQLTPAQMRHALGLCSTMASGLKSQFGTMGKPLNAGLAARTGVEAALWAKDGLTSTPDGLAGPLGFGETHHGQANAVDLPGAEWRILRISHKFHACCHGLHASLEAVQGAKMRARDLASIEVTTHPRWMSVCNKPSPATGLAAKFSYAQTIAMQFLGHDTGAIDVFSDAMARDADVIALRQKVRVVADDSLSETQARVVLHGQSGQVETLRHDLMATISPDVLGKKLRAKAAALLGRARADALWQAAQGNDLRDLTDQLVMS